MKDAPGTRDYDWWLLAILATICALGVVEVYSTTHGSSLQGMHMKQVRWLVIGFAALYIRKLTQGVPILHPPDHKEKLKEEEGIPLGAGGD